MIDKTLIRFVSTFRAYLLVTGVTLMLERVGCASVALFHRQTNKIIRINHVYYCTFLCRSSTPTNSTTTLSTHPGPQNLLCKNATCPPLNIEVKSGVLLGGGENLIRLCDDTYQVIVLLKCFQGRHNVGWTKRIIS